MKNAPLLVYSHLSHTDTQQQEPEESPAAELPPETQNEQPQEAEQPTQPPEEEPVAQKEPVKRVKVRSTLPSEGVDIAMGDGVASVEPRTVGEMFQDTYQKWPNREALMEKVDGAWVPTTFTQYYANCLAAAKSFRKV